MAQTLKTKNLFLVPFWIVNILERNGLPLSTVKDLVKLREVASAEDLVLTLMLNQDPTNIFGVNAPTGGPALHWCSTPEAFAIYSQLVDLEPLHEKGLEERLYSEQTLDPRYPKEFDIRDPENDMFLVIIYPGHFGGADATRHQTKLVRAYLELWYGYSNFDSVARDPLFRQYLSRL